MSYSLGWSEQPAKAIKDFDTSCSICHEPLRKGQDIQDQEIHKCGEFQYFELAHAECVCMQANGCSFCDYDEERNHCHTLS